jgi:hypothetical protein
MAIHGRVARFFMEQTYYIPKWEKCTKWPQNIPNGNKIDQMAIKGANIPLQDPPKFTQIGILF